MLEGPATPLFQAIRIKRTWKVEADIVVKGPGPFEDATFGDADDE
jgi:hypothetical protein